MRVLQFFGDSVENPLEIRQHIVVPEAEHSVTLGMERRRAFGIELTARRVLPTIDLHDQLDLRTAEIDDVRA